MESRLLLQLGANRGSAVRRAPLKAMSWPAHLEQDCSLEDGVRAEINRVAADRVDPAKLRRVLQDFDTLFAIASAAEREELLELLIKRITFRGMMPR